jgi:hypothetical protein
MIAALASTTRFNTVAASGRRIAAVDNGSRTDLSRPPRSADTPPLFPDRLG